MKNSGMTLGSLVAGLMIGAPIASAHHSYAMFDGESVMTLEGEVKEFQWTNPHGWIHMNIENENGEVVVWPIETGAPAGMARDGWRPETIRPGDRIEITFHPLRNGGPGGSYMSAVLPDGTVMGSPNF